MSDSSLSLRTKAKANNKSNEKQLPSHVLSITLQDKRNESNRFTIRASLFEKFSNGGSNDAIEWLVTLSPDELWELFHSENWETHYEVSEYSEEASLKAKRSFSL